jgi:hypothetical protein
MVTMTNKRPEDAFVPFAILHLYAKKLKQLWNYLWPRADNLRLGRYLRNAESRGYDFRPSRQHGSATTNCVKTFIVSVLLKSLFI